MPQGWREKRRDFGVISAAKGCAITPIIAQLRIVLFGGSAAQLIGGCESRKRAMRPVLRPG